jgi:hypothetical protein
MSFWWLKQGGRDRGAQRRRLLCLLCLLRLAGIPALVAAAVAAAIPLASSRRLRAVRSCLREKRIAGGNSSSNNNNSSSSRDGKEMEV